MDYAAATYDYFDRLPHVCLAAAAYPYRATVHHAATAETVQLFARRDAESRLTATFLARGGIATLAAAAWSCDWLNGKTLAEAQEFTAAQVMIALALPPLKIYSAVLIERAWRELATALSASA